MIQGVIVFTITISISQMSFANEEKVHWGYTGKTAPKYWSTLNKKNQLCADGTQQSPIDIRGAVKAWLPPLQFDYHTRPTEVVNNGHTIQVNIAEGSTLKIQNETFELKQFHFHSSSENRINGHAFPLEVHFVHANKKGDLAVVAMMFEMGLEHAGLAKLWEKMPMKADEHESLTGVFKQNYLLLPQHSDYYYFKGSLTTPPCSEGVQWFVLSQTQTISAPQLQQFRTAMGHPNNRPLQPKYGRKILK